MRDPTVPAAVRLILVGVPSLAVATLVVEVLQEGLGVPNVSAVYLIAVVASALVSGTTGAVLTAIASFLLDDFLFTDPRFTFVIAEPGEVISVVVLLFVGVVVGQLAALQRSRTGLAETREREARAQFQLSRALATRTSTPAVLPEVVGILVRETATTRVWISLGPDDASERVAADSAAPDSAAPDSAAADRAASDVAGGSGIPQARRPGRSGLTWVLRRTPGDAPAEWVRVHEPGLAGRGTPGPRTAAGRDEATFRVRIEADGRALGSIWALRPRAAALPTRSETRLMSAAADLVGLALAQDRLAAASQAAEIAQASDALKSALLQSVSHDLRTPLATIRAAAGSLRPDSGLSSDERAESSAAIEREVEYLNRLVTNLLDLSRIEAGALRAERDAFDLEDLLGPAIERARGRLGGRSLAVALGSPPVLADPVLVDAAVTNLLDNAIKHTPDGTAIRIAATEPSPATVRLTVEDAGPGVPKESVGRLFDKFYRVPGRPAGSRGGTGIGLAVVRGLSDAMGARVRARRSELGGLAIDLDLPVAPVPAGLDAAPAVLVGVAGTENRG